ncbi:MAG: hypothetical protein U0169_17690 [Polyangiaceae bacterium]
MTHFRTFLSTALFSTLAVGTVLVAGCADAGPSDDASGDVSSANTVDGGSEGGAGGGATEAIDTRPFLPLTTAKMSFPDGLGRPPTSADLTLETFLDGLTPDEAEAAIRAKLTNTIHSSNQRFVTNTIRQTLKAMTVGTWNLYAPNGPRPRFLAGFPGAKIEVLGTMSSVRPYVIAITPQGQNARYFALQETGGRGLEELTTMRYPVIVRAEIQRTPLPDGTRVTYPTWSATVLTGPTGTVTEGGSSPVRPRP